MSWRVRIVAAKTIKSTATGLGPVLANSHNTYKRLVHQDKHLFEAEPVYLQKNWFSLEFKKIIIKIFLILKFLAVHLYTRSFQSLRFRVLGNVLQRQNHRQTEITTYRLIDLYVPLKRSTSKSWFFFDEMLNILRQFVILDNFFTTFVILGYF